MDVFKRLGLGVAVCWVMLAISTTTHAQTSVGIDNPIATDSFETDANIGTSGTTNGTEFNPANGQTLIQSCTQSQWQHHAIGYHNIHWE